MVTQSIFLLFSSLYIYSFPLTCLALQENVPEISLVIMPDLALTFLSVFSLSFSYMTTINLNYTN